MYKTLLTLLLVSAIVVPTLAYESDGSFVILYNNNGLEKAIIINNVAESVDSFIKEHGPNLVISPNGPTLELGKTWADYQVKPDSVLLIDKSK